MMNVQTCLGTLQTDGCLGPPTDCLHESEAHSFLWSPLPPLLPPLSIEVDLNFFFLTPQVWSSKVGHLQQLCSQSAKKSGSLKAFRVKSLSCNWKETSSVLKENSGETGPTTPSYNKTEAFCGVLFTQMKWKLVCGHYRKSCHCPTPWSLSYSNLPAIFSVLGLALKFKTKEIHWVKRCPSITQQKLENWPCSETGSFQM